MIVKGGIREWPCHQEASTRWRWRWNQIKTRLTLTGKRTPLATGMRNFLKLEQMLEQIQEKKQQVEKEIEERVGSLAEARQRNAMLIEAKERISQHMKAHKKKVHDLL